MRSRAVAPLPTRDGVGPSCVVLPTGPWPTIASFLEQRFPAIGPEVWAARIAAGEVVDEHGEAVTVQRAHQPQLRLYYYREVGAEPVVPFDEEVLFQDEHLLVVDKPHFLPVTPSGHHLQQTLLVRLKRRLGLPDLAPIHRLDRETAGVMLFSVQPATRAAYQRLFAQREVTKHYECIAPWRPALAWPLQHASRLVDDEHFMRVREVPGEPNAHTALSPLEHLGPLARYRLSPLTGRRHQLRVHCAALGLPILHDRIYPVLMPADSDDFSRPLQLLARELSFRDPLSGTQRHFQSPRSLDLAAAAGVEPGLSAPSPLAKQPAPQSFTLGAASGPAQGHAAPPDTSPRPRHVD